MSRGARRRRGRYLQGSEDEYRVVVNRAKTYLLMKMPHEARLALSDGTYLIDTWCDRPEGYMIRSEAYLVRRRPAPRPFDHEGNMDQGGETASFLERFKARTKMGTWKSLIRIENSHAPEKQNLRN